MSEAGAVLAGGGLCGASLAMAELRRYLPKVAASDATVLVTGETGTGKERVATAVHNLGPRAGKPFVAVNCAALPEAVAEIELFGHDGDSRLPRTGRIEASNRGTLFLDEIESTLPAVQAKLLRVLEEREVMPVGGDLPSALDLRVIAAAKPGLDQAVEDGRFRAELLFRLDAVRAVGGERVKVEALLGEG